MLRFCQLGQESADEASQGDVSRRKNKFAVPARELGIPRHSGRGKGKIVFSERIAQTVQENGVYNWGIEGTTIRGMGARPTALEHKVDSLCGAGLRFRRPILSRSFCVSPDGRDVFVVFSDLYPVGRS